MIKTMTDTKNSLTKKDLQAIEKIFNESIRPFFKEVREIHRENVRLVEKLNRLVLKMEKIGINEELISETFLDVMVLVRLHNKKIKDLEKALGTHTNQ